ARVGDLADGHAAKAVPGEHDRAGAVGVEGREHGRHVVVVADPGTIFADVAAPGQGGCDHAVAVGPQAVADAVPAPGALPGAVHENKGFLVCHAVKAAATTPPWSSRCVVILTRRRTARTGCRHGLR